MKPIYLLPAFLLFVFVDCKKGSPAKPSVFAPATTASIQGKWELRKVVGGYIASYPAGNGNTLKFTGNHYARHDSMFNIVSDKSGTFSVIMDEIPVDAQCAPVRTGQVARIVFDNNIPGPFEIPEVAGDTLKISTNNCPALDNYSELTYKKIKE